MAVPDNIKIVNIDENDDVGILLWRASLFAESIRLTHELVLTAVLCEVWMIGIGTLSNLPAMV